MSTIYEIPCVKGFIRMCNDGWLQGWHERNGGNLTYRMTGEDVAACRPYFDAEPREWVNMGVQADNLAGEYFITTGSGKFLSTMRYCVNVLCPANFTDNFCCQFFIINLCHNNLLSGWFSFVPQFARHEPINTAFHLLLEHNHKFPKHTLLFFQHIGLLLHFDSEDFCKWNPEYYLSGFSCQIKYLS